MSSEEGYQHPAVAGSGVIACGLAASASALGETLLLARSERSAEGALARIEAACQRLDASLPERVTVTTEIEDLAGCDVVVEAIAEELDAKSQLLAELGKACPTADLASTTSSLSIAALAKGSGQTDRLYGLHVFNPVTQMELVEVCFPDGLRTGARERALAWCGRLGKTPVEVPDEAGFVVNRLLFPYLFDAVRLLERTGMAAADVDACMTLGAGHPMGPLALLDFVGIDVAVAIGKQLQAESGQTADQPPDLLASMAAEGKLGRKSGAGFFDYGSP